MNELEYGVGVIMLAIFLYLCGLSLWLHTINGVILFGGFSIVMMIGFLRHFVEEETTK